MKVEVRRDPIGLFYLVARNKDGSVRRMRTRWYPDPVAARNGAKVRGWQV